MDTYVFFQAYSYLPAWSQRLILRALIGRVSYSLAWNVADHAKHDVADWGFAKLRAL